MGRGNASVSFFEALLSYCFRGNREGGDLFRPRRKQVISGGDEPDGVEPASFSSYPPASLTPSKQLPRNDIAPGPTPRPDRRPC